MRPRSLHLRGFTVFRTMDEPVSFVDADLFALTGPTGSGKTSLLDAMCFALYGRVPRLDARAVEPVISLGALEARVSFEFSVGSRIFTAARVVRRTKTGATTPEARLEEHVDEAIEVRASGVVDVNEAVVDLLGLSFDHFTKAVLLPQGAFAAFLHDPPGTRQELLRTLLDLDVYERMRGLALRRRTISETEAENREREVARLAHATAQAESEAETKLRRLKDAAEVVNQAKPELDSLASALEDSAKKVIAFTTQIDDLASIRPPNDVEVVAKEIEIAGNALVLGETALGALLERVGAIEDELADLPGVGELAELQHQWRRRSELGERIERGKEITESADQRVAAATLALSEAVDVEARSHGKLTDLEIRHRAHGLAETLVDGHDCPVCLRAIEIVPILTAPEGLDELRGLHASDVERIRLATEEAATARAHLASCALTLEGVSSELAAVDTLLEGRSSASDVAERLEQTTRLATDLAALRNSQLSAGEAVKKARAAVDSAKEKEKGGRRTLATARDRVVASAPPELDFENVAADWATMAQWAVSRREELVAELAVHSEQRTSLADRLTAVQDRVEQCLIAADAVRGVGDPFEKVVRALTEAEQRLIRVREDRAAAVLAVASAKKSRIDAEVAKTLARHLQVNGFEGWLMEEALDALVAGANGLLADLSGGAYSLEMDQREFSVIDHRNADETRGVKTLSGGETFLVSLALALSLAEQIGSMALVGAARLESIFLDEGFGTLDSETLDVVAAVIHDLGATGRTVGLVTHVKELAELVPVRFEISRLPGGSTVRRVEG